MFKNSFFSQLVTPRIVSLNLRQNSANESRGILASQCIIAQWYLNFKILDDEELQDTEN